MNEIIGKVIKEIYVDQTNLVFISEDGKRFNYEVEADCCSDSYFSEIMHPESILGHKIVSVEELEEEQGQPTMQDEDTIYGFRITSNKEEGLNACIINFRNSSNGYYGGWCRFSEYDRTLESMRKVESNYIADWETF